MVAKRAPIKTTLQGRKPGGKVKKTPPRKRAGVFVRSAAADAAIDVSALRGGLGLSRRVFARLSGYSERALAEWEAGKALSDSSRQRMVEMDRLRQALARVMKSEYMGVWLQTPNEAFRGLKPLEVVERGEIDRLWQMIYLLESGQPG